MTRRNGRDGDLAKAGVRNAELNEKRQRIRIERLVQHRGAFWPIISR